MSSVKANTLRLPLPLICLLTAGFLVNSSSGTAQAQYPMPPMEPIASDDIQMMYYNETVPIEVLMNDYAINSQLDSSTLTIVNEPLSGSADVDPILGVIVYTPNANFAGFDQIQYQVSDTAGNVSNIATVDIYIVNMPPTITLQLPYEDANDMWVFRGSVSDENPSTCTVTFGGLLAGNTVTVNQNGEFVLYLTLDNGEEGPYTAQATDEVGDTSDIATEILFRY